MAALLRTDSKTGFYERHVQVVHPEINRPPDDLLPYRLRNIVPLTEAELDEYVPSPLFLDKDGDEAPDQLHQIFRSLNYYDEKNIPPHTTSRRNNFTDLERIPRILDGSQLEKCIKRRLLGAPDEYGYQIVTVKDLLEKYR